MSIDDWKAATLCSQVRQALPPATEWLVGDHQLHVCIFESPLSFSKIELVGWEQHPEAWGPMLIFGEWRIPGGASPYLCLSKEDGKVFCVDVEADDHTAVLNSTVVQFICCFETADATLREGGMPLESALQEIEEIDRTSFVAGNEWRRLIEHCIEAQQGAQEGRAVKPRAS